MDDMNPSAKGRSPRRKERQHLGRAALTQSCNDVKTLHKASRREVVSGGLGHGAGRACCRQHRRGKESEEYSTRYVVQSITCIRVCVELCPLTTRQTAKRSGDSCQTRALGRDHSTRDDTTALAGLQLGMLEASHGSRCTIAASRWHSHRVHHDRDGDVPHPNPDGCHSNPRLVAAASLF